ncbi:MAG: hypothetical protein AAF492_21980, partial [Verrucomicrobiota bacterium]
VRSRPSNRAAAAGKRKPGAATLFKDSAIVLFNERIKDPPHVYLDSIEYITCTAIDRRLGETYHWIGNPDFHTDGLTGRPYGAAVKLTDSPARPDLKRIKQEHPRRFILQLVDDADGLLCELIGYTKKKGQ